VSRSGYSFEDKTKERIPGLKSADEEKESMVAKNIVVPGSE
jgi:hypothetical protein